MARERHSKNRLAFNKFEYKRTRIAVNQKIGTRKKAILGLQIRKIADKKITYNEGCLHKFAYQYFLP